MYWTCPWRQLQMSVSCGRDGQMQVVQWPMKRDNQPYRSGSVNDRVWWLHHSITIRIGIPLNRVRWCINAPLKAMPALGQGGQDFGLWPQVPNSIGLKIFIYHSVKINMRPLFLISMHSLLFFLENMRPLCFANLVACCVLPPWFPIFFFFRKWLLSSYHLQVLYG